MSTELEQFLAARGARGPHRAGDPARSTPDGITYIYFQFVSVTGRVMGKGIPAAHWASVANKGFQLVYGATANLFLDRHGRYIGYGPESSELVGLPDVDTFTVLPWDPKVARVFCTLFRGREEADQPGGYLHVGLSRQPAPAAPAVHRRYRAHPPGGLRAGDDVAQDQPPMGRHRSRA